MNEIKVQDFFSQEFPNFAVYNLYRMVASYIDGLKPSQRKIVYTMMKNNIKNPKKVSQLAADVSSQTQYLHGEVNLQGVIVNMVQNFAGTNNMNLLYPESSFGNRCFPQAAAARYIFTRKTDVFDKIFNPEDNDILIDQEFEGDRIEPKFYVPTLPMILINGSEGIGSGWAQKILPRNPKDLKKAIKNYLDGKVLKRIKPWFGDFTGTVEHVEGNSWDVSGILIQKNLTTFRVTEIPPNVSLDKYTAQLIKLEDKGIITSFTDYSDPGTNYFEFTIKVKRDFSKNKTHEQMLRTLYLTKRMTENFTCMDENNKVREFQSELEILQAYCDIRFKHYSYRKANIIKRKCDSVAVLMNKCNFIDHIITNKLKIKNMTKAEIVEYLGVNNFDKVERSFNYLLNMPIYNMSTDQHKKLMDECVLIQHEIEKIKETSEANMWLADLSKIN